MYHMFMLGAALIPWEVTRWLQPLLQILMAVVSVFAIVVVLMQKSSSGNIGAIGGQETDSYMGKNKSASKDRVLKWLTIAAGITMLVLSVLFFLTYLEK